MTRTIGLMTLSMLLALGGGCGDDDAGSGGGDGGSGGRDGSTTGARDGSTTGGGDSGMTGGSDSGGSDGGGGSGTCPDLMPTQGADNVIISQIDVENDTIEFFNPTSDEKDLKSLFLCSRPGYFQTKTNIKVPSGEYATISASSDLMMAGGSEAELKLEDNDEFALYTDTKYMERESMFDFVCWGTTPMDDSSNSRIGTAKEENMDKEVLWDGDCAANPNNGVIRRTDNNNGASAASYDVTGTFETHSCP